MKINAPREIAVKFRYAPKKMFDKRSSTRQNAQRLCLIRDTMGLTQRQFAKELGVTSGAIAQWECRKRSIPGPVLKLIDLYERELGMSSKVDETLEHLDASWLKRATRLSRTTVGAAAQLAGSTIQSLLARNDSNNLIATRAQKAIAHRFVKTLGEMKGLAMKVGQMVSFLDFALPEEARAVLEQLQSQSQPMAPSVVASVFEREFGRSPREIFDEWSFTPIAAASIGQVHKARMHDGTWVAVKVQYPDIDRVLRADLANGQLLDRLGTLLFQGQKPGVFIEELRQRILEECDYQHEAQAQSQFASLFSKNEKVLVPGVISALSTKRILTSQWVDGDSFQTFRNRATQEEKNRAGETIFQFAFETIFRHGRFNADPHPGNYLFLPDKIAFIDFGCVRYFDLAFIDLWKQFARAVLERDWKSFENAVVRMGFTSSKSFDFVYHRKLILKLYRPWLCDEKFCYTDDYVTSTWATLVKENPNKRRMNIPREWVLLNRLQWGLNGVLAQLRATSHWRSRFLSFLYPPSEKPPPPFTHDELKWVS